MIDEKSKVPNRTRYEVVDKDGKLIKGKFRTAQEASEAARWMWPDQEQDEDRTGKGWDVQAVES
jgi:hypothetical protein